MLQRPSYRRKMVIQILPFTASDHPGTDGPILVYDFDGARICSAVAWIRSVT